MLHKYIQNTGYIRPVIIPIGPSIAYVELTQGQYALIDREDAAWAGQWNWYARWGKTSGHYYAGRNSGAARDKRILLMHSEILGLYKSSMTADHITTGNGLDNRRCNLRPASHKQQSANRSLRSDSQTGAKGVGKVGNVWRARIQTPKGRVHLGCFSNKEEAHAAYCKAAVKYFGEFARTS